MPLVGKTLSIRFACVNFRCTVCHAIVLSSSSSPCSSCPCRSHAQHDDVALLLKPARASRRGEGQAFRDRDVVGVRGERVEVPERATNTGETNGTTCVRACVRCCGRKGSTGQGSDDVCVSLAGALHSGRRPEKLCYCTRC